VVRIANIKVGDLSKNISTGADLVDLMVQAINKIPVLSMGKPVFYANETIVSYLERQIMNKSNVYLNLKDVFGAPVLTCRGIPVRKVDSTTLLNTESTVS
jgi:hypothetical protein